MKIKLYQSNGMHVSEEEESLEIKRFLKDAVKITWNCNHEVVVMFDDLWEAVNQIKSKIDSQKESE